MIRSGILVRCAVMSLASFSSLGDGRALADMQNVARLEVVLPSERSLTRNRLTPISATARVQSSQDEPLEFTALMTINGQSLHPFYTLLTPGEITGEEKFTWFVRPAGQNLTIRFRLIVIGNLSKTGYEVADVSRDYPVIDPPKPRRPSRHGICRCGAAF